MGHTAKFCTLNQRHQKAAGLVSVDSQSSRSVQRQESEQRGEQLDDDTDECPLCSHGTSSPVIVS